MVQKKVEGEKFGEVGNFSFGEKSDGEKE